MSERVYLGIDTSNYTTSAAVFSDGNIVQEKKLLPVEKGKCGLRQSDAVFHHTAQLPQIIEKLSELADMNGISAVGASFTPRSVKGSYMPCFTVGSGFARCLAEVMNIPVYAFSHQQGHIAAAVYSCGERSLFEKKHLAFHVSGGTTEAIIVTHSESDIINTELVGRTLDLNAGQLIDRVGVMLGLEFPCGAELEKLALGFSGNIKTKPTVRECDCCISGVQNICENMYKQGTPNEEIAAYVFEYVEKTLLLMTENIFGKYGKMPVLFSGGVMSNRIIRKNITEKLGNAYFAKPEFSSDNAAGIAVLTAIKSGECV